MTTPAANDTMQSSLPLFVDLDGTLVQTDLLYESFLDRLKRDWLLPVRAAAWLVGGKAHLKTRLAQGHALAVDTLPYNEAVLDRIRAARAAGRGVYLATASHMLLARQVADHLRLFDGVIATEPGSNVSGRSKLGRLREQTGSDRFEYLGNSGADIPIWDAAMHAGVVAPDSAARGWLARNADKAHALGEHASARSDWLARLRALRPHQWLKNLLLGLPLVAAHKVFDLPSVLHIAIAFLAFSLCASAVYVINDLLDLDSDRAHPHKRQRPFASGAVPLAFGFRIAPLLLAAAFCVGSLVSWPFNGVLAAYLVIAFAYSLSLKHKMAIDVLTLAALCTLRVVAGAVAIPVVPSHWLLGFSIFLFFGLALVKRSSELMVAADAGGNAAPGRNYRVDDLPMVNAMGVASSYLSVLVLALYISSPDVGLLYARPYGLWLLCPLQLYWLTRLWLITRRGGMHDDPVVYAARDGVSRAVGLCCLLVVLASTVKLPF
jgi:4-hydroxybenzoate polyprenyltransferase/phosphoserine phosphatase